MTTVVIDTNILIGASHDEYSYPRKIVQLVIDGDIRAVASNSTLRENKLLLSKAVKDEEWHDLMQEFFEKVEYISVDYQTYREVIIKDDPEDDKFIYTALIAEADYVISSDAHLLDLVEHEGIKMVSPADFWHEYKNADDDGDDEWKSWIGGVISNS